MPLKPKFVYKAVLDYDLTKQLRLNTSDIYDILCDCLTNRRHDSGSFFWEETNETLKVIAIKISIK